MLVQVDGNHLNLIFAGGGVIQLEIEALAFYAHDLGTAWPTQWRPEHDVAGEKAGNKVTGR
jgi:hypothetical protein